MITRHRPGGIQAAQGPLNCRVERSILRLRVRDQVVCQEFIHFPHTCTKLLQRRIRDTVRHLEDFFDMRDQFLVFVTQGLSESIHFLSPFLENYILTLLLSPLKIHDANQLTAPSFAICSRRSISLSTTHLLPVEINPSVEKRLITR